MVSAYFVADTIFTPNHASTQDGIARTLASHPIDVELQSWHFDAVVSRGSPFHSLNRTPAGGLAPARRSPVSLLR